MSKPLHHPQGESEHGLHGGLTLGIAGLAWAGAQPIRIGLCRHRLTLRGWVVL